MTERLSEREKLIENIRKFMDSETTKYVVTDDYGEASESLATEIATWHLAEVKRIDLVARISVLREFKHKTMRDMEWEAGALQSKLEELNSANGESEGNNETPKMR